MTASTPKPSEEPAMHLKPIRTEAEHAEALADIERMWDAHEASPEADHLEVLTMLVEAYEKEHHGIDMPDPANVLIQPYALRESEHA
jgi:HTH-type transcriptional regulator / antitoxin HigA